MVIGDFILFIVAPPPPSPPSRSSLDQSGYESSPKNEPNSDAFDPFSDQEVESSDAPDSDNVDLDFPEHGYCHA